MTRGTRTIVIDSLTKLEKALLEGQLIGRSLGHKTVSVSFQLQVPRKMRAKEVKDFIAQRLQADELQEVTLYKGRIEVFMP
jgi:hypothetical protein